MNFPFFKINSRFSLLEMVLIPLLIANLISTLNLKPTPVSAGTVTYPSTTEAGFLGNNGCPKTPKGGN